MDEIALLFRAGAEFDRRLGAVTPGQLLQPSPCEGWTVRDLVSHVVGESIMSVRLLHGANAEESIVGLDDILGDDASAAWATAASAERAAFEEPGVMERVVHHPAMDMPGAQLLGFRIGGLILHTWDLARGHRRRRDSRLRSGRGSLDATITHGAVHCADGRVRFRSKRGRWPGRPATTAPSGPIGPPSLMQAEVFGRRGSTSGAVTFGGWS